MIKNKTKSVFIQGNEALAEGAIAAGLKFYAGYPITPATEIMEYLSKKLPKYGGIVLQTEDEIAAVSAAIGASWTGNKAMTATSGPGFSLMQESIGYAYMTETPLVVVDIQRAGPSTGQATKCAQGDVMQARWGTHGDYNAITLSPNSVQEMYDLAIKAFNLSEQYRTPVIILGDEIVAHMREVIYIRDKSEINIVSRRKPDRNENAFFGGKELVPPMPSVGEGYNVVVTGSTHDEYGIRETSDAETHKKLVERLKRKIDENIDKITDVEIYNIDSCKIGIVSYGCTSRAVYDAIRIAESKGLDVGHLRLKTIWPFPEKLVSKMAGNVEAIFVPEMNLKQIFYEVQRVASSNCKVFGINKIGGGELLTPDEILSYITRSVNL